MTMLCFEIRSWWHAGAGRGTGALLDALVVRDSRGCPILPGRTVKGLVRDAVLKLEDWGHLPDQTTTRLFGSDTLMTEIHPGDTEPGLLAFGDAALPRQVTDWLASDPAARDGLFGELHATAIDPESGRAKRASLRGIEVAVPLALHAPVRPLTPEPPNDWQAVLRKALPLIRGLGQSRHRGLGRVVVTLEEVAHAS